MLFNMQCTNSRILERRPKKCKLMECSYSSLTSAQGFLVLFCSKQIDFGECVSTVVYKNMYSFNNFSTLSGENQWNWWAVNSGLTKESNSQFQLSIINLWNSQWQNAIMAKRSNGCNVLLNNSSREGAQQNGMLLAFMPSLLISWKHLACTEKQTSKQTGY